MDKQKFGKYFYITSLVIALVVLLFGRRLLGPKENMTEANYIRYSKLIEFSVFALFLPIGVIVREYFLLVYNKKVMFFKLVVFSIVVISGTILFFMIPTVSVSQLIIYMSYASLIFILIPSNSYRKFDKE